MRKATEGKTDLALIQERLKAATQGPCPIAAYAQGCARSTCFRINKGGTSASPSTVPDVLAPGKGFVEDSPLTGQGQGMASAQDIY